MTRGRKAKPIEIRDAEGNLARRPLPEPLLKNIALGSDPPDHLGDAGKDLWRELVGRLNAVGALDSVDRVQLTAMCIQWDRAVEARSTIEKQGLIARGSMGQPVEHPAVKIERAAHAAVLKFAAEFAATPVARARVATAKAAADAAAELAAITGDGDEEIVGEAEEIDGDVL